MAAIDLSDEPIANTQERSLQMRFKREYCFGGLDGKDGEGDFVTAY